MEHLIFAATCVLYTLLGILSILMWILVTNLAEASQLLSLKITKKKQTVGTHVFST